MPGSLPHSMGFQLVLMFMNSNSVISPSHFPVELVSPSSELSELSLGWELSLEEDFVSLLEPSELPESCVPQAASSIASTSSKAMITVSLPVVEFAKELEVPEERLYRALAVSNLVAIHQKKYRQYRTIHPQKGRELVSAEKLLYKLVSRQN